MATNFPLKTHEGKNAAMPALHRQWSFAPAAVFLSAIIIHYLKEKLTAAVHLLNIPDILSELSQSRDVQIQKRGGEGVFSNTQRKDV